MKHYHNLFSSSTRGAQLFFVLFLIGSVFGVLTYDVSLNTVLLVIFGYFVYACLGVIITFHRNLTHQSYQTYPWLTKLFSFFGCLAGTGSSIVWVAIHLNHHLKSDRESDPHSPAHQGLKIFTLSYNHSYDKHVKTHMKHLIRDPFHQFLHRYYFLLITGWSLILFLLGGLYLMIFLHWVPAALTAIFSNVVNYVGHKPTWFGSYRNYNINDQSANNWLWALPTWGESWHNNHHRHPRNYMSGHKWWEIDISGLIIKGIRLRT